MGLSYHKSIKLFGNTRLNISKRGGIGISTGVKGARVSINKQGVRTSVGGHGFYYRKQTSWNEGRSQKPLTDKEILSSPETLRQYNQSALNAVMKRALKWYVIVLILAIILGTFTATIGFWILFVLDCIAYLAFIIASVRQMLKSDKEGKILFKN